MSDINRGGVLLTLEGVECSGKDTQLEKIRDYLAVKGIKVIIEHEPGGTLYGEAIRAILKEPKKSLGAIYGALKEHSDYPSFNDLLNDLPNPDDPNDPPPKRQPMTELYLFEAARAEFCAKLKPLLEAGEVLLVNRFADSTTAYQGGGHTIGTSLTDRLNIQACLGIWPTKTFFLDIPIKVMQERIAKQPAEKNAYFEHQYDIAFYARVRDAYQEIAQKEPTRFITINGNQEPDKVFDDIRLHLDLLFNFNHEEGAD